ncbi:MAG: DUF2071 domain-containing protein [Deltaproteobacteria bacterium]|nr:DUF2071 domain-containing protein [Deltaproteobacteria bacterium]
MRQVWHDLVFAHWPVAVEQLRPLIPGGLQIDTYDGQAWIAIVPFRMSGIRPRLLPPVPWLSAFPELNVRTYVSTEDKPGVWFFSLEAANPIAVAIARRWYLLPYFYARMSCQTNSEGVVYSSHRIHRRAPAATFRGHYRPTSGVFQAHKGSLEYWLTERYCLYTVDAQQHIYRGEIDHPPWPLQLAEATIEENTMTTPLDIRLPEGMPLLHFSRHQEVVAWPLSQVSL